MAVADTTAHMAVADTQVGLSLPAAVVLPPPFDDNADHVAVANSLEPVGHPDEAAATATSPAAVADEADATTTIPAAEVAPQQQQLQPVMMPMDLASVMRAITERAAAPATASSPSGSTPSSPPGSRPEEAVVDNALLLSLQAERAEFHAQYREGEAARQAEKEARKMAVERERERERAEAEVCVGGRVGERAEAEVCGGGRERKRAEADVWGGEGEDRW